MKDKREDHRPQARSIASWGAQFLLDVKEVLRQWSEVDQSARQLVMTKVAKFQCFLRARDVTNET